MRSDSGNEAYAHRLRVAVTEMGRVFCLRDPFGAVVDEQLTRPQVHAVLALSHEALPMGELSRRLGATGPTITGIVDRLEKLHMVERHRDEQDRRVVRLHLTDAGQALSQRLLVALDQRIALLLGLLEESDCLALVGVIERLATRVLAAAEPEGAAAASTTTKSGAKRD